MSNLIFEGVRRERGASLLTAKLAAVALVTMAVGYAQASSSASRITYINNPSGLRANDTISWGSIGTDGSVLVNPTASNTASGIKFRVTKPTGGMFRIYRDTSGIRLGDYMITSENSARVNVEFETPVTSVGAMVRPTVGGNVNLTLKAFDKDGNLVLQTTENRLEMTAGAKFMGAFAQSGSIKSVEFSADAGVIDLGRIDLRNSDAAPGNPAPGNLAPDKPANQTTGSAAMAILDTTTNGFLPPVAIDKHYSVKENDSNLNPNYGVLYGDLRADTARLIRMPMHAESFQLNADGSFYYKPERYYRGPDSFTYVSQNGGGQNESTPATVRLDVLAVNQGPSFHGGPDQDVSEDCGPIEVQNWSTGFDPGAPNEAEQKITWYVNNDNPTLFAEQPSVLPDGTLRYVPARGATGLANVQVWLRDDGGTLNGGVDMSNVYRFKINLKAVAHPPMLQPISDQRIRLGDTFTLRATGSHPDAGKIITYSIVNGPNGLAVQPLSGQFTWTPTEDQIGSHEVVVRLTDSGAPALSTTRVFKITVLSKPDKPSLAPIEERDIMAGESVKINLRNYLRWAQGGATFLMASAKMNAHLDPSTGVFTWSTNKKDQDTSAEFLVTVLDAKSGQLSQVQALTINVAKKGYVRVKARNADNPFSQMSLPIISTRRMTNTGIGRWIYRLNKRP